jgi:hemerythrin
MQATLNALNQRCAQLRQQARDLALCPDTEVPRVFKDLLDSLEQLFAFEHSLMEQHHFPASRCHVEQHARALRGLHRTHSQVMCGAYHKGRYVGAHLLMHWFELHNETLDACLAAWLECLQSGQAALTVPRRALWPEIMQDPGDYAQTLLRPLELNDKNNYSNSSGQDGQSPGK